jgi:hypothetical protein
LSEDRKISSKIRFIVYLFQPPGFRLHLPETSVIQTRRKAMNTIEKKPLFEEMKLEETDAVKGGLFTYVFGAANFPVISLFPTITTGFTLNLGPLGQVTF